MADTVDLNSKGKVLSFRPDDGTECFLMQYVNQS